jgi:hypothetical protein
MVSPSCSTEMWVAWAPIWNSATIWPFPAPGWAAMTRSSAARAAYDSMSITVAVRPAASAIATRSSTFSRRAAASITSMSSGEFGAGPITSKSRLTSSSANGMYWLASDSTCTSSWSSPRPAGRMIFLVMTAAGGMPSATCLARVPLFFQTRRTASDTCFDVFDIAVDDGAARQRFGGIALQAQRALAGIGQLDQAHAWTY